MHANAENITIVPAPGICDVDPQEDHDRIATTLKLCTIPSLPERMIAVFLGEKSQCTSFIVPDLVLLLMAECLERYARSEGGCIVYATAFADGREQTEKSAACTTVMTDGGPSQFVSEGFLFLHTPTGRAVVHLLRPYHCEVLVGAITVHAKKDAADFYERWKAYATCNHYFRRRAGFPDGELVRHARRYSWDDVVLSTEVKRLLQTHVHGFFTHAQRLRASGMKRRRGLILSGPPGTGKTLVGKVLADTLGDTVDVSFLWVLPRHVNSTEAIHQIVSAARFLAPAVVLFEDLDLFGEDRDANRSALLGELMNQLDGVTENDGLVTIATTNRLEVVERALRNRPGRFDRVIRLEAPDHSCREQLLDRLLKNITIGEPDRRKIARATEGFTPAQLEELVNTIHLLAAEDGETFAAGGREVIDGARVDQALKELNTDIGKSIGFH